MNSRERFYSAMRYEGYDRPPTHHYGTPEIDRKLMDHFGIDSPLALSEKLGDDLRVVAPRYIGPELRTFESGEWEGIWGERYIDFHFGEGSYKESSYLPFKEVSTVAQLEDFRFPSSDWYDYSNIEEDCRRFSDYAVCIESAGTPDYLNGIARCRGVEQVLIDVALEDPVFLSIVERRFQFFYQKIERTLEAAKELVDVVCFGEDLGHQTGSTIGLGTYDRMFAPSMKALFDLAHRHGALAMMHSCGSVRAFIPRLIEMGLDILEVVQVDTANMDIRDLHRDFYGKIGFCGSVSVQSTLPFGTRADVIREVNLRKELFKDGGMVIAPTHAIQVGTPLENILAMYEAIGSLEP